MGCALAVVDPALGVAQGHHTGFAAVLAAGRPAGRSASLWTHRTLAADAAQALRGTGIRVEPRFATNYYRHFGKSGNGAALFGYIGALAREYAALHRQVAAEGAPTCLLYHTLGWEHANALSLALQAGQGAAQVRHCVLLMFCPGIAHDGRMFDRTLGLNYRIALRRLHRLPGVRLFAGCSEHAAAYARLLDLAEPLPVHPCLLGNWGEPPPPRASAADPRSPRLLLYLGDAKANKGFNALPETIARLQRQCGPGARFVVQYNRLPAWADAALRASARQLETLAAGEPRLELHRGFWSDEQLRRQLCQADLLLLNYDPREYAEKSSGLVWLAAWYGLPTLLPPGWPQREARRLGLPHAPCAALDDPAHLPSRLWAGPAGDAAYRRALFTPLWSWLDHTFDEDLASP